MKRFQGNIVNRRNNVYSPAIHDWSKVSFQILVIQTRSPVSHHITNKLRQLYRLENTSRSLVDRTTLATLREIFILLSTIVSIALPLLSSSSSSFSSSSSLFVVTDTDFQTNISQNDARFRYSTYRHVTFSFFFARDNTNLPMDFNASRDLRSSQSIQRFTYIICIV